MSLENYTTTGNILPIGLLVCGNCKDKHLKGLDFANSLIVEPDGSLTPGSTRETLNTQVAAPVSRQNSNLSVGPVILGANGFKQAFNGRTLADGALSVVTKGGVTISRSPLVTPTSATEVGKSSEVKVVMHPVQREAVSGTMMTRYVGQVMVLTPYSFVPNRPTRDQSSFLEQSRRGR